MNTPTVSIIVPVYNVEKYLSKCLDSILAQTYTDFEAILVDDGSTDQSGKICDEYVGKDDRFCVLHHTNEGVAKARLTGFDMSKGNFIAFIDSDDYVTENYLEKLMEPVLKDDVDMVSCQNMNVMGNEIKPIIRPIKGIFNKDGIKAILSKNFLWDESTEGAGMTIFLWSKLIRRQFVREALEAGNGLWWGEDQIAVFHLLQHINSLVVLSDCLYCYVKHEGQVTSMYKTQLWYQQFAAWKRYKELDENNYLRLQLPARTWKFTFKRNIKLKMPTSIKSYWQFVYEMWRVSSDSAWNDFFSSPEIQITNQGEKKMFKYLRYRLFTLFYFKFYRHFINK